MMRTVVIVGTLLLGVGAVMAQQDALKHAQTFMKGNGKNAGALGAMVKGEKPYDQATVNAALAQFEDTAKNLPTLFPDSLKGAKPGGRLQRLSEDLGRQGWLHEHITSFGKTVADAKGKITDLDSLKATLTVIGKQCGGCHETFRVKKS